MTATVPQLRPVPQVSNVLVGRAVTSDTWTKLAQSINWINGQGSQIIPSHTPYGTQGPLALLDGSNYEYQYYVQPRVQGIQRHWVVTGRSADGLSLVDVFSPIATQLITDRPRTEYVGADTPIVATETVASQSAAEAIITLKLDVSGGDFYPQSIACYEVPRWALEADNTDDGCDLTTFSPRQPISAVATGFRRAVLAQADSNFGKRGSLLQWCTPYEKDGTETTDYFSVGGGPFYTNSTSYVNVFNDGVPSGQIPVLGRRLATNDDTNSLKCRVLFKSENAAATATFQMVVGSSGASSAVTTTSTSWAWSNAITFDVDASDFSEADFLLAGGWDTLQPQLKTSNATYKARIAAISVWED